MPPRVCPGSTAAATSEGSRGSAVTTDRPSRINKNP